MNEFFNVGDKIYGFCNGYFGRDDYESKICVMVNYNYAVFQYLDGDFEGSATVLNLSSSLDKDTVTSWKMT